MHVWLSAFPFAHTDLSTIPEADLAVQKSDWAKMPHRFGSPVDLRNTLPHTLHTFEALAQNPKPSFPRFPDRLFVHDHRQEIKDSLPLDGPAGQLFVEVAVECK